MLGRTPGTRLEPGPWTGAQQTAADPLGQGLGQGPLVLVLLDALRAQQVGAYGYGRPTTPRLDQVAAEGVVFERAYASAAILTVLILLISLLARGLGKPYTRHIIK